MTKRQRAQVVELLRCAADERVDGVGLNGMFDSAEALDADVHVHSEAWDAIEGTPVVAVRMVTVGYVDEGYRHRLLEAAQRTEEGSWPTDAVVRTHKKASNP